MAFVPRETNKAAPTQPTNAIHLRECHASQVNHTKRIHAARATTSVDSRWTHAERKKHRAARNDRKKALALGERTAVVERENHRLCATLVKGISRPHDSTKTTRPFANGVRLDANQLPVIDHVAVTSEAKGPCVSVGAHRKRRELQAKLEQENRDIVRRLQRLQPTLDFREMERQEVARQRALELRRRAGGAGLYRIDRGTATLSTSRSQPHSRRQDRPPFEVRTSTVAHRDTCFPASVAMPRVTVAAPRQRQGSASDVAVSRGASSVEGMDSELDPAVAKALDLIRQGMPHGSPSISEMRAARDDLLLAYAPLDGSTELSQISADGVRFEVVRAAAAASEDARVLILVHGGIFMLGSPKGWRHLAERFSAALRVPVVLPALRLAPEHTFPAPLDDLAAAYRHVATHGARTAPDSGVDATPPSHIALFAESSGAGIALSMLQARLEAREEPMPCAVVLVSPWLDLTCSSQSFRRNARSDPVIKKEALLNIAQVYLGRAGAGAASAASPLRAPSKVFSRMPPTLIHVDARESLLDDSRRLEAKLRSANAPVRLREWRSTLHGWHALYPIFEPAEEAIADVVSFLSDHLFEQD